MLSSPLDALNYMSEIVHQLRVLWLSVEMIQGKLLLRRSHELERDETRVSATLWAPVRRNSETLALLHKERRMFSHGNTYTDSEATH